MNPRPLAPEDCSCVDVAGPALHPAWPHLFLREFESRRPDQHKLKFRNQLEGEPERLLRVGLGRVPAVQPVDLDALTLHTPKPRVLPLGELVDGGA